MLMSYEQILSLPADKLLNWLTSNFLIEVPEEIVTVEDMKDASKLLLQCTSYYSYLCALSSYAKLATRNAKRSGDKTRYEDMIDKKEIVNHITDCVKQQYSAISRAVTIHIDNNQELRMLSRSA